MIRHRLHPRFIRTIFATIFLTACPLTAIAAETPQEGKASDEHLRGLEIAIRPMLGGAGGSSPLQVAPGVRTAGNIPAVLDGRAAPYGTSIGASASLGFRFHPLISAGLRGDLGSVSASAVDDGTRDLSRGWQSAGLYLRGYPLALNESLRRHIDPWLGVGVAYVHDRQSFKSPATTNNGATVDADWQIDNHALGVPLSVGFDYRLTPAVSLGPSFEYFITSPIAGCAKQSAAGFQANRMCSDNDETTQALAANAYGMWNVGLSVRFTPFR